MRISAVNLGRVGQGIKKGARKVATEVNDVANKVSEKVPQKVRQYALPVLIGLSTFTAGVMVPNKAQAQNVNSITEMDSILLEKQDKSDFDKTFNIQDFSKDGSLKSAYHEMSKATIKEVDRDNDEQMNFDEYLDYAKKEIKARLYFAPDFAPYKSLLLKEQDEVAKMYMQKEFDFIDLNKDKKINAEELATMIAIRDNYEVDEDVQNQRINGQASFHDGKVSLESLAALPCLCRKPEDEALEPFGFPLYIMMFKPEKMDNMNIIQDAFMWQIYNEINSPNPQNNNNFDRNY